MASERLLRETALAFGRVRCSHCLRRAVVMVDDGTTVSATLKRLDEPCRHCRGALGLDLDYVRGARA